MAAKNTGPKGRTMKLSDQRLEQIRSWLAGEAATDPDVVRDEYASIVHELTQLRLRVSSGSRSTTSTFRAAGH
jgi:hypothetical protein